MKKMSGHICDSCSTMFYPNDKIYEVCPECFNAVWCVINVYSDNTKELCSIHHTKEGAEQWVKQSKDIVQRLNLLESNKLIDQQISQWCVL